MSGKAAKTNIGVELERIHGRVNAGSPSLQSLTTIVGSVIDVRLPSEIAKKEGQGIMVKVYFDKPEFRTDAWLPLKMDTKVFLATIGNRSAALNDLLRISYHFRPIDFNGGYAELISDERQESLYESMERNRSTMFINVISNLAMGTRAIS
jgi:hypothetical protein